MSYGAQLKFGIARQATPNSWVTAATSYHAMPILDESVVFKSAELISQNLIGRFDQGASFQGTTTINGTIDFECTPRNLGAALMAAIDYNPTQVISGSVATYLSAPNTQDYSSTFVDNPFSIYKQYSDANSAELYYDCQFSQLDMSFSQGQFMKGKLTVAGGTRLATGIGSMAITPAASDVGQLFPWVVSSLSYGGAGLSQFSDLTISINRNIDALYTLNGTLAPFKYTRKGFQEITIDGTFYMNDRSMLNNFAANVQQQLLVTVTNTLSAIQSGYYNTLKIDIPQLKLTAVEPTTSGPGEVAVKVTGRGVLDPTSAYTIQFTFQNSYTAGY